MSQELEGTLTNTANLVGNFGSEGGGGTTNYNDLINKPSINSVTLQGNKTATQLGFAEVATSGNYDDLTNKPTIPAAQVNSDWNASSGVAEILNKPTVYQNAAELPVSSSNPTDTKTYIDNAISVEDISSLCSFNTDWVFPAWGFYKVLRLGKIVQISVFGASYTGGISQATTLVTLPNTAKVNYQQIILYGVSNNINIASIDGGSNEVKILPYGGDYIRLNMVIMVN